MSSMVSLRELVQVGAVFRGSSVRPVWFSRHGRKVQVQSVTMRWRSYEGRALVSHFAVTDGLNLYELTLNHQDLIWHLTKADEIVG